MKDLSECKIKEFDDIFISTKDSQGYKNAVLAIKYVLFNDDSVFNGKTPISNKYLYISSKNDARKKAITMQQDDLAHILIKYCMASFGLRGKDFNITNEEFVVDQKRIDRLEISPYEMIEAVSFAAIGDLYTAYSFLYSNKKLLCSLVEYMIEERYVSELKELIDNFNGIIDNKDISTDTRYAFYDAYNSLDENFSEIKRNNPEYSK